MIGAVGQKGLIFEFVRFDRDDEEAELCRRVQSFRNFGCGMDLRHGQDADGPMPEDLFAYGCQQCAVAAARITDHRTPHFGQDGAEPVHFGICRFHRMLDRRETLAL